MANIMRMQNKSGKLNHKSSGNNSYGTTTYSINDYDECILVVSCVRQRDVVTDLSAKVSKGTLELLQSVRPNVSSGYNMVTYQNIYKGKNIGGTLTITGGYSMSYTIVSN